MSVCNDTHLGCLFELYTWIINVHEVDEAVCHFKTKY